MQLCIAIEMFREMAEILANIRRDYFLPHLEDKKTLPEAQILKAGNN